MRVRISFPLGFAGENRTEQQQNEYGGDDGGGSGDVNNTTTNCILLYTPTCKKIYIFIVIISGHNNLWLILNTLISSFIFTQTLEQLKKNREREIDCECEITKHK